MIGSITKTVVLLLICTAIGAVGRALAGPADSYVPSNGPYVNDRNITIRTSAEALARRAKIARFIWGPSGLPRTKLPSEVRKGVASPVAGLVNLERVDTLRISMAGGVTGMAHHFIPKMKKQQRLVILHLGHSDNCTFNDGGAGEPDTGMRRAIKALLGEGYPVLAVYMPQVTPEDCRWQHDKLFTLAGTGSPLKFFLEPTLASLNYLEKHFPRYRDFTMIGLSGGGWTTTVYAAVDRRIKLSIPVAGSLPLYLSHERYGYDIEQRLDGFYRLAGYLDLYLLGILGKERRQIQILNRHDDCCFGERQHDPGLTGLLFEPAVREYERRVQMVAHEPGFGSFRVIIDDKADRHQISRYAIDSIILPELSRQARVHGGRRR